MRKLGLVTTLALAGAVFATPGQASEQASPETSPDNFTEVVASTVVVAPVVTEVATTTNLANITRGISRLAPGGGGGGLGVSTPGSPQTSFLEGQQGMAAGGGEGKIGVWINSGWSDIENDLSSTAMDGDVFSVFGGADYMVTDRLFLGVSAGWETSDIDTTFNRGTIESDGFTIAPYALFVINNWLTFDASAGYSWLNYDTTRTNLAGTLVNGSFDSNRWFASANLTGYYSVNNWNLSGSVGYLYTKEEQDSFTESDGTLNRDQTVKLGQINVGATVGYSLGKMEPYVTATYQIDTTRTDIVVGTNQAQPANDETGFILGGGVRFSLSDRVSGALEATTEEGREDVSSTTVNGTIRIRF